MDRDQLLNRIKETQAQTGFVSPKAISEIASEFDIPESDVYGVATFYAFISTKPLGRHVIRVCKSVPCYLNDGETVAAAIMETLGISPGETSSDGRFTFLLTNCIGACDQAPAMLVDDTVYGNLTPLAIREILQSYD